MPMKATKPRPRARNERVSNPKQRRQQHLLDVRVRSHKATQHRNRRVLVVIMIGNGETNHRRVVRLLK